jgi:hypothetical protein
MSGTEPVTMPNPPEVTKLVCGYCVKGMSVVQGAVPCQQHWYQDCYDTMLIFLEYEIVAMGRRSMNVDVAVMR